jgi:hypothetical protein
MCAYGNGAYFYLSSSKVKYVVHQLFLFLQDFYHISLHKERCTSKISLLRNGVVHKWRPSQKRKGWWWERGFKIRWHHLWMNPLVNINCLLSISCNVRLANFLILPLEDPIYNWKEICNLCKTAESIHTFNIFRHLQSQTIVHMWRRKMEYCATYKLT